MVPLIIGSNRAMLYELCHEMQDKGLFLAPVDYPSVPEDGLRFRAAVTAAHTRQDLDDALVITSYSIHYTKLYESLPTSGPPVAANLPCCAA